MLSILIPAYNQDVSLLVRELHKQCVSLFANSASETNVSFLSNINTHPFEIIILDDGSSPQYKILNQNLATMPGVIYQELSVNVGRSAIRNKLADIAKGEYLLFIDGDSGVKNQFFVSNYISYIHKADVVSGGRVYPSKSEIKPNEMLHYRYGTKYESKHAIERNKEEYLNFHSNNFVIKKEVFSQIHFDDTLDSYGYEDVLFGKRLREAAIQILHIDNPVIHLDIEKNDVFLAKTITSLQNLYRLKVQGKIKHTRLIAFEKKWIFFRDLILLLDTLGGNWIKKNLQSPTPNVYLYQFWKLCQWLKINKKGGK